MNAAGQALIETIILSAIFMLMMAAIAKNIPITFSQATPLLATQVESRLQTGVGFSTSNVNWSKPLHPKGGIRDQ